MTENEAVIELKAVMNEEFQTENQEEAYKLAIKALEKQIPKKPNKCVGFSESLFICPTCGRKQPIMYGQYHCKECGQKLDWNTDKEETVQTIGYADQSGLMSAT